MEYTMSETLKSISNIRNLRALAREATLEQVEALFEKVQIVLEEKREAEKAKELAKAQRLENLKKYKELLEKDGISAEELAVLLGGTSAPKKQREPRPAKYKFLENGVEKTWTGQGRTPKALQEQLNKGKSLKDFEI